MCIRDRHVFAGGLPYGAGADVSVGASLAKYANGSGTGAAILTGVARLKPALHPNKPPKNTLFFPTSWKDGAQIAPRSPFKFELSTMPHVESTTASNKLMAPPEVVSSP